MTQGILPGFLVGQQYNGAGQPLSDRTGAPLVFTPQVKLIETGSDLERTGIRVIKYPIDYTGGDNSNNDYVYFKISDVILMKAEAILRGGTATGNPAAFGGSNTALGQVNFLRTHASRGASALASLTLDNLLDESGRELYWERTRKLGPFRIKVDAYVVKDPLARSPNLLFADWQSRNHMPYDEIIKFVDGGSQIVGLELRVAEMK
jgi:hypothetical protein